jgi:putative FmdB family regulatory protein
VPAATLEELTVPTYAYACTECGHRFDAVQSFTDAALTDCPECTGRLRKVFSSVGIVFKGSGFYRTDSRAQANGSNGSNGSKPKSSENGSTTSKEPAATPAGSTSNSPSSTSTPTSTDRKAS